MLRLIRFPQYKVGIKLKRKKIKKLENIFSEFLLVNQRYV